ncbi:MAG: hypothetical protein ACLTSZ_04960 [Lachnospiraceae bacterium]
MIFANLKTNFIVAKALLESMSDCKSSHAQLEAELQGGCVILLFHFPADAQFLPDSARALNAPFLVVIIDAAALASAASHQFSSFSP